MCVIIEGTQLTVVLNLALCVWFINQQCHRFQIQRYTRVSFRSYYSCSPDCILQEANLGITIASISDFWKTERSIIEYIFDIKQYVRCSKYLHITTQNCRTCIHVCIYLSLKTPRYFNETSLHRLSRMNPCGNKIDMTKIAFANSVAGLVRLVTSSIETHYWTSARLEIAGTESLIIRITGRSVVCEN